MKIDAWRIGVEWQFSQDTKLQIDQWDRGNINFHETKFISQLQYYSNYKWHFFSANNKFKSIANYLVQYNKAFLSGQVSSHLTILLSKVGSKRQTTETKINTFPQNHHKYSPFVPILSKTYQIHQLWPQGSLQSFDFYYSLPFSSSLFQSPIPGTRM